MLDELTTNPKFKAYPSLIKSAIWRAVMPLPPGPWLSMYNWIIIGLSFSSLSGYLKPRNFSSSERGSKSVRSMSNGTRNGETEKNKGPAAMILLQGIYMYVPMLVRGLTCCACLTLRKVRLWLGHFVLGSHADARFACWHQGYTSKASSPQRFNCPFLICSLIASLSIPEATGTLFSGAVQLEKHIEAPLAIAQGQDRL